LKSCNINIVKSAFVKQFTPHQKLDQPHPERHWLMPNENSSERLDQGSKRSLQNAQQLIQELQNQYAALLTSQSDLENEQRQYRDLFELSPIGLLVLDAEARILEANLSFVQMLGIQQNQVIGAYLSHFVVPDAQDSSQSFLQHLRISGQPQQCEINLINHGLLISQAHRTATQPRWGSSKLLCHSHQCDGRKTDRD
jgi:PAS domain-containing protein